MEENQYMECHLYWQEFLHLKMRLHRRRMLNQKIESVVSVLNSEGYDTSFFHGAPNGSMGFLGFSNILRF